MITTSVHLAPAVTGEGRRVYRVLTQSELQQLFGISVPEGIISRNASIGILISEGANRQELGEEILSMLTMSYSEPQSLSGVFVH